MEHSENSYSVVEFLEDKTVEVVPASWLLNDNRQCYWPLDPKLDKARKKNFVQSGIDPVEYPRLNWKVFDCKILISTGERFSFYCLLFA